MTTEQKILDASEFTSLLLSCLLAVEFNKDKPNKAIKHTLKVAQSRLTSPTVKLVAQQGIKQIFPLGWLNKQLNNVSRFGNMDRDEFLAMGASL